MKPKVHKFKRRTSYLFPVDSVINQCGIVTDMDESKIKWSKVTCKRCLAMKKEKRK